VSLLIGRNPSASADWPDAELLAIDDPAKTVSKTHAAIEMAGPEVWVHDLNSTNGVTVERADGETIRLQPRERVMVSLGDLVSLGSLTLRIQ
jgi:pSer/pThr/pTyr-binding forkhead associated (FHA) protein